MIPGSMIRLRGFHGHLLCLGWIFQSPFVIKGRRFHGPESMFRGVVEIFVGPCVGVGGWNIPMPSVRVIVQCPTCWDGVESHGTMCCGR